MSNNITFLERFQLWNVAHKEAIEIYAGGATESDPELGAQYDQLVKLSFDRALDLVKTPATSQDDINMKRLVWETEEGHLWGPDEIRDVVAQLLTDAAHFAKRGHDWRSTTR